MITDSLSMKRNPTEETIDLLKMSPFHFRLTGSRFFGTETRISDWDFYVEASPEVSRWLEDNEFVRQSGGWYLSAHGYANTDSTDTDGLCEAVYLRAGVHIQLVNDAVVKERTQEILKKTNALEQARNNKKLAKVIWAITAEAVRDNNYIGDESAQVKAWREYNKENAQSVLGDFLKGYEINLHKGDLKLLSKLLKQAGY